jgi:hypothetical protein
MNMIPEQRKVESKRFRNNMFYIGDLVGNGHPSYGLGIVCGFKPRGYSVLIQVYWQLKGFCDEHEQDITVIEQSLAFSPETR